MGFRNVQEKLEKVRFLFQLLNWEKFVEKIGENKIRGLVVWCHEQDKGIDLIIEKVSLFLGWKSDQH